MYCSPVDLNKSQSYFHDQLDRINYYYISFVLIKAQIHITL